MESTITVLLSISRFRFFCHHSLYRFQELQYWVYISRPSYCTSLRPPLSILVNIMASTAYFFWLSFLCIIISFSSFIHCVSFYLNQTPIYSILPFSFSFPFRLSQPLYTFGSGSLIYLHLKLIYKLGLNTILLLLPIYLATVFFFYYLMIFFDNLFL